MGPGSFVKVLRMSEHQNEPSGNTEQFQAFARRGEAEPTSNGPNVGLLLAIGAVAIVVIAVVAFVAF